MTSQTNLQQVTMIFNPKSFVDDDVFTNAKCLVCFTVLVLVFFVAF